MCMHIAVMFNKMSLILFSPTELAEEKKAEGNTFYKNQQYPQALQCYSQAIGKDTL